MVRFFMENPMTEKRKTTHRRGYKNSAAHPGLYYWKRSSEPVNKKINKTRETLIHLCNIDFIIFIIPLS